MEIAISLGVVVLLAVALLVGVRRRSPQGDGVTAAGTDTSVLHCAAPPPTPRRR